MAAGIRFFFGSSCEVLPCTALSGGDCLSNLSWRSHEGDRSGAYSDSYNGHVSQLPSAEACFRGLRRVPLLKRLRQLLQRSGDL